MQKKLLLFFLLISLAVSLSKAPPAMAICTSCFLVNSQNDDTRELAWEEMQETAEWINEEFILWEEWLAYWLMPRIIELLPNMTKQMAMTAMHQMFVVGTFFDAKHQLEVQRVFQRRTAETHHRYHPSIGVCEFATLTRSLAATEQNTGIHAAILNRRALDRQLGAAYTSATEGEFSDRANRLTLFRERFCHVPDGNMAFGPLCDPGPGSTGPFSGAPAETVNKDINYGQTIDRPRTLRIDMTDTGFTPLGEDEIDIFALADNLYGHRPLARLPESIFLQDVHKPLILDLRAVAAKRNVAQTSYFTIAGLKAPSKAGNIAATMPFLNMVLDNLGMDPADVANYFTVEDQTSYYAYMEILTKRLFQEQSFFTQLYDTPENVGRKKVVMKALELMQNFDRYESYLRTEMMLSLILELEVIELQKTVQNRINRLVPVEAG